MVQQQIVMEVDTDAVGEQLRIFQDQFKEKSKEYDRLFEEFNQTSQVYNKIPTTDIFLSNTLVFFCKSNNFEGNILLFTAISQPNCVELS